jgi:hypothetical protein
LKFYFIHSCNHNLLFKIQNWMYRITYSPFIFTHLKFFFNGSIFSPYKCKLLSTQFFRVLIWCFCCLCL